MNQNAEESGNIGLLDWYQRNDDSKAAVFVAKKPADSMENMPPEASNLCVFPGSFNPIHSAHRQIAELAYKKVGRPLWFEISIRNVDKAALRIAEVRSRIIQDFGCHGVVVSTAATFAQKATVFRKCTFVVGADTIIRIADPAYYDGGSQGMLRALTLVQSSGCRFLVFDRKIQNIFDWRENISKTPILYDICEFVDSDEFLMDMRSSEIRGRESGDFVNED